MGDGRGEKARVEYDQIKESIRQVPSNQRRLHVSRLHRPETGLQPRLQVASGLRFGVPKRGTGNLENVCVCVCVCAGGEVKSQISISMGRAEITPKERTLMASRCEQNSVCSVHTYLRHVRSCPWRTLRNASAHARFWTSDWLPSPRGWLVSKSLSQNRHQEPSP